MTGKALRPLGQITSTAASESDDFLPLSALQHMVFCERQAALIHIERAWEDDVATAKGHLAHERADEVGVETRRGVRVVRSLPLRSDRWQWVGIADLVELHSYSTECDRSASKGVRPLPVELKSGKRKPLLADKVQVAAQAICLEEMFEVHITEGAIFYVASKRRVKVSIDQALREQTLAAAKRLRALISQGLVPPAVYAEKKCRRCSLQALCLPTIFGRSRDAKARLPAASGYLQRLLLNHEGADDDGADDDGADDDGGEDE